MRRSLKTASVGALIGALSCVAAHAQFGLYQLPKNDFKWNWGHQAQEAGAVHAFEDFRMNGAEGGFNCELSGRFDPARPWTPAQIMEFERQMTGRLDFIAASANYMNELEQQHAIDWATLDCKKQKPTELSDQEKAEREAKAREKMQREIDRRREKQGQP